MLVSVELYRFTIFFPCVLRRETSLFQVSLNKSSLKSDTSIRKHPDYILYGLLHRLDLVSPCASCDHLSTGTAGSQSSARRKLRRSSREEPALHWAGRESSESKEEEPAASACPPGKLFWNYSTEIHIFLPHTLFLVYFHHFLSFQKIC